MQHSVCLSLCYQQPATREDVPADVPEHLPAVMYISCEYFDNSIKALRGIVDPRKRKIVAHFQLSEPSSHEGQVRHMLMVRTSNVNRR